MLRGVPLAALLVLSLAGCVADEEPPTAAGIEPATLRFQCLGQDGDVPALETSFFGTCWGHIGHQTYFVPEPVALVGLTGDVFAVEITYTTLAGEPELPVEVSLDGRDWTVVGTIPYPLGEEPDDRYTILLNLTVEPTPFRFLRVSMPLSTHEGLAGYLDDSNLTATVVPWTGTAPLAQTRSGDCADGDMMETYFEEHPCWFGGFDQVDEGAGGQAGPVHAAVPIVDESWYDSPSFLHTYVLGGGAGGSLVASVTAQTWRLAHYGTCSGQDPTAASATLVALADASADGVTWAEVARAEGTPDRPVALAGTVPDGAMFLRFGTQHGASWDAGGCHHPQSFLVDSSFTLS